MKLAKPITITFTDQAVAGLPFLDDVNGYIKIPVLLTSPSGLTISRDVVMDRPKEVTDVVEEEKTFDIDVGGGKKEKIKRMVPTERKRTVAQCQRLALNPDAKTLDGAVRVEQFENVTAFANARKAMKADDEIAALEAAGITDGWLFPVATKPTKEEK